MNLDKLVSKYIASVDHVLKEIIIVNDRLDFSLDDVKHVVELAKEYLHDAKYYRDRGQLEVSLASVAYCEGLLDALRMLRAVMFEWPVIKEKESGESGK